MCDLQIFFFHSVFHTLGVLWSTNIFNFDKVQLTVFFFFCCASNVITKKPLPDLSSQRFIMIFFLRLVVWLLPFQPLLHPESVFTRGVRHGPHAVLLQVDAPSPQPLLLGTLFFPAEWSWHPFGKLIDHKHIDLFQVSQSCSFICTSALVPGPRSWWL